VIYATNTNKEEPDIMKNRSVGTSKSVFVAGDFVGYVAAGVVIHPKGHSAVGRIGGVLKSEKKSEKSFLSQTFHLFV
jgi:hypothetical protein